MQDQRDCLSLRRKSGMVYSVQTPVRIKRTIRGTVMGRDSELVRLEKHVERLLEEFTNLRAEKQRLEQEVLEQQAESRRLREVLDGVDSERTDVCDRVNSLIERLERWESELESDESTAGSREQGFADAEIPEQMPEEEDGVSEEEAGGSVQGSLFTG